MNYEIFSDSNATDGNKNHTTEIQVTENQKNETSKTEQSTTQKSTAEQVTPAAKNSVLTDATSKCKVVVTSSDANNPTVAYKQTTNSKATKVTVPDTITIDGIKYKVTSVADNAVAKNKKITKVVIGKNVTSIGKNAFKNCTKLKTVEVKSTVLNKIGANAFSGDKKLTKITLKTTKLTKKSVGKNALKGTNKKLVIKVPKKQVSKYKTYFKNKGNKTVKVKK